MVKESRNFVNFYRGREGNKTKKMEKIFLPFFSGKTEVLNLL
jgi:hypothetical protein